MSKDKTPSPLTPRLVEAVVTAGEKLGIDTLIFVIVALGSFGCLAAGINPWVVLTVAALVIFGWLGNKFINAYLIERHENRQLRQLKEKKGAKLFERYGRRSARNRGSRAHDE